MFTKLWHVDMHISCKFRNLDQFHQSKQMMLNSKTCLWFITYVWSILRQNCYMLLFISRCNKIHLIWRLIKVEKPHDKLQTDALPNKLGSDIDCQTQKKWFSRRENVSNNIKHLYMVCYCCCKSWSLSM